MTTLQELLEWQIDAVESAGNVLIVKAGTMADASEEIAAACRSMIWEGAAAQAAANYFNTLVTDMVCLSEIFSALGKQLQREADVMGPLQQKLKAKIDEIEQAKGSISPSGVVTYENLGLTAPFEDSPLFATHDVQQMMAQLQECGDVVGNNLQSAESAATGVHMLPPGWQTQMAATSVAAANATMPPLGADPAANKAWWASLSPTTQAAELATNYARLGFMLGLPAAVLDAANRHRLIDDKAANSKALATAVYGSNEWKVLTYQKGVIDGITSRLGATTAAGEGVMLLAYSLTGANGAGTVMISMGDNPDTATNILDYIPGMNSKASAPDTNRLATLVNAMDIATPDATGDHNTAVFQLVYQAPQGLTQAASDMYAQQGVAANVMAIKAIEINNPNALTTVLGHSYGSYEAGLTMASGQVSDDNTVFVGSPGVGVNSASAFYTTPTGHVWSGQASSDPINFIGSNSIERFTDQTSPAVPNDLSFGANRFDVASHSHLVFSDHSDAYFNGEVGTRNIAYIATGQYSEVTSALPTPTGYANPGTYGYGS